MADGADIEYGVVNALADQLPDLTPLYRAAYVFELESVERRLVVFGATQALVHEDETLFAMAPENEIMARTLWRRRGELLGVLWPPFEEKG